MPRPDPPDDSAAMLTDDEVVTCSCCEEPEEDCCCIFCESCEEMYEDGNGCEYGHCDHCSSCCECTECNECSNVVFVNGEPLDDTCTECDCCCDCCSCHDEDENGNQNYSTNPISVFEFKAKDDSFSPTIWRRCKPIKSLARQRFGIEIEKSHHSHDDDSKMNHLTCLLSRWQLLDSRVTGYSVACEDASLSGSDPAESKTCPLTFRDHQMCLYAYMMNGMLDGSATESDHTLREHLEQYHSLSSLQQFKALVAIHEGKGRKLRWQSRAKAWSNDSCGMHVNVSNTMSTEMTLYKVFLYIVRSHPSDMKHIGGRSTLEHYCRTHHDKQIWCGEQGRNLDMTHFNYMSQVGQWSDKHQQADCNKHDAMSRRPWHGWEMRLFRSSTNPLRILGNMQIAQLLCDYFQYVPISKVEHTGLAPIVRHSVLNRRTFPYAAACFARQAELVEMIDNFKKEARASRTPKRKQ